MSQFKLVFSSDGSLDLNVCACNVTPNSTQKYRNLSYCSAAYSFLGSNVLKIIIGVKLTNH